MRKLISVLLLSGVSIASFGQADAKCPAEQVCVKAAIEPRYMPGIDSMKIFFNDLTFSPNANGQVDLQLVVCYQGDVFTTGITNRTNLELDESSLKRWLSLMTGWKPAQQNGRAVAFSVSITLTIRDGMITKVKCQAGTKTTESARRTAPAKIYTSFLSASV